MKNLLVISMMIFLVTACAGAASSTPPPTETIPVKATLDRMPLPTSTLVRLIIASPTSISTLTPTLSQSTKKDATPESPASPTTLSLGLGISSDVLQEEFQKRGFEFETTTTENGTRSVAGTQKGGYGHLNLFGPQDNISRASMSTLFGLEDEVTLTPRNKSYFILYLNILAPDWTDASEWLDANLPTALNATPVELVRGTTKITLYGDRKLQLVALGFDATAYTPPQPRPARRFDQEPDVSGRWVGVSKVTGSGEYEINLTLTQTGDTVEGTQEEKNNSNPDVHATLKIRGTLSDGVLHYEGVEILETSTQWCFEHTDMDYISTTNGTFLKGTWMNIGTDCSPRTSGEMILEKQE